MRKLSNNNTNDGQRLARQTVYQRGGQREGSPHYVLLYSDGENSGDEDTIPLRTVSKCQSNPRRIEVIKIQLQPEDTLQALSLRYGSTISELKRINNIHKENEIFAHRTIRVPVSPFSLLTETLNNIENSDGKVEVANLITIDDKPSTSREEQIINLIATPIVPPNPKTDFNFTILNSLCEPSTSGVGDTSEILEGENDQLIPLNENNTEQDVIDTFGCSGADWGLSWTQLVGGSLLLAFGGPLIYILLYLDEYTAKHSSSAGH